MGAGKTCIGRRLARRLGLAFVDADDEMVKASACSIADIFRIYGEAAFREGERKVMRRLLSGGPRCWPAAAAPSWMPETRGLIREQRDVGLAARQPRHPGRADGRPAGPAAAGGPRSAHGPASADGRALPHLRARPTSSSTPTNEAKDAVADRIVRALSAAPVRRRRPNTGGAQ